VVGSLKSDVAPNPQASCRTTLIGFSQGAIMALESTQLESPPAARVKALSGRFARPPRIAHGSVRTQLMHGDADAVMPVRGAVDALAQLQGLGAVTTLDRFPGLGHGIDRRVVDAIVRRLDDALPASIRTTPGLHTDIMSNERSPAELESDFAAVARVASGGGPQAATLTTLLHIGDEHAVVLSWHGDKPETVRRLDLGAARIARAYFHHDPPTSREIERAIDFTEDEIIPLGKPAEVTATLWSTAPAFVAKISGLKNPVITGPARVFDDEQSALEAIMAGRIKAGDVMVLRYLGPKGGPGMPEMLAPIGALIGQGLGESVGLITDGRFSGGTWAWWLGTWRQRHTTAAPSRLCRRLTRSPSTPTH
jgi:hypothetical protein